MIQEDKKQECKKCGRVFGSVKCFDIDCPNNTPTITMTREEQIRQAGIEYTIKNRPRCIGGDAFSEVVDEINRNRAFEEGAKWADKTMPKKFVSG